MIWFSFRRLRHRHFKHRLGHTLFFPTSPPRDPYSLLRLVTFFFRWFQELPTGIEWPVALGDRPGLPFKTFELSKDPGEIRYMPSGTVPFEVPALLLKVANVFRIAGNLGSMPAGNPAVMYLFIVASKAAPFSHINMVSIGHQLLQHHLANAG